MKRKNDSRIFWGLFLMFLVLCFGRKNVANAAEPEPNVLTKQCQTTGSTELFHYQITADNELIITGLTETAETEKKNRILTIPETIDNVSVAGIAEGAFAGVPLTSVTLPEGLLEIGRGAFYGCNLNEIVIPASVCYIGPRAFGANYSMREILVSEENQIYSSRTGVLYDKEQTMLLQMPANFEESKFTIVQGVNIIGEYAFGNCKKLTRVYGDESAMEVREMALWNTPAVIKEQNWVGNMTGTEAYTFEQLEYNSSWFLSYHLNDNQSISIQYEKLYGELILELYEMVDLKYCTEIALKLDNEVGKIGIKLYDQAMNEVESFYLDKTVGQQTIYLTPGYKKKIAYIGFMAGDDTLFDYSGFETILYSLEFRFECNDAVEVTYYPGDFRYEQFYYSDFDRKDDGALFIKYDKIYGEVKLHLPEEIDMSKCTGVTIKTKNEMGSMAVKLYDEEFNQVDVYYGVMTMGVQDRALTFSTKEKVAGIGFMACDDYLMDYSRCETTIYSVTFYMDESS